jgi:hypothetical protein
MEPTPHPHGKTEARLPREILQNALGYTISGANPLQALAVKAYGLAS